jgi:RNA polymerase primary sigma factor
MTSVGRSRTQTPFATTDAKGAPLTTTIARPDDSEHVVADPFGAYLRRISTVDLLTAAEEVELGLAIEAGILAAERLGAGVGDDRLRVELEFLADEGERARLRMIQANVRLVVALARRYATSRRDLFELVQDGTLGLIHAVRKFDYRRGCKFSTYASWWIRQAISRGLAESERSVRLPAKVASRIRTCQARRHELTIAWGREPTYDELAEACGGTSAEIEGLFRLAADPLSLEYAAEIDLGVEQIADPQASDPGELVATTLLQECVQHALDGLTAIEREVVARRYGLDGAPRDRKAVASELGLDGSRLRQIEQQALATLRASPSLIALTDEPVQRLAG